MKAFYRKIMDRMVHPNLERKFSMGRRSGLDRRNNEGDRRIHTDSGYYLDKNDRRRGNERRLIGVHEPRQRWLKINKSQSRHFLHDL